ncbi:poly(beta-D-mannuronate) lyase [Roseivirga ehrenbergii]|uniref:Alginate lyase n=1 Tax=Roseivirga ehrenbergii (strain DSM 102268 / JCM 13514 / KCTC 12282 / NCIMB 14502 / KMM 6017) TaxID=279360 RepID=A0A150X7X9_ROSEK|nr:polysaccharide lyase 6 family protein [Roseivirga ehrenbergii]KYG74794.1 alginate lyase [Roseivirga ehrenbergii]TCL13874.1 poly(beta-D-mannuronate) lyase [Roseivirga ehrenbergii]
MYKSLKQLKLVALAITLTIGLASCGNNNLVNNFTELEQAISAAQPGTEIVMANGVWTDVEIEFKGVGTADQKIILRAETPGKVFIEGESNLSLSGEFLEVSGLVFRNGFTPTAEVISFRTSSEDLANNSRVTNCVIDNFNIKERFDSDLWVAMYGKNNRFDHNSLIGKRNQGVTMAVRLNTEASRENNHLIDYNYFGPRQNLGSNGGETLRIGTSHYSLTNSRTMVSKNYFDRTNGEHETISNKSGNNTYKDNVFFESRGTLTMRHGQYTLVEGNYFLGNRKSNTGGIRVINEYQTVRNNYLSGLTGYRFRGALVVMNGVPNSPINRYNQVVDSKIEGNVVVDSDHIQLAAGSDEERSAVPIGSSFTSNIIMSETNLNPFTVYDDVSGISFEGNIINDNAEIPFKSGFDKVPFSLTTNAEGLLVPDQALLAKIGMEKISLPVSKEETGASYYPKPGPEPTFRTGEVIKVAPGTNTLLEAFEQSSQGDVLELENGKDYLITKDFRINHLITIKAPTGDKPIIKSRKSAFFHIENEGGLELDNIKIDGAESPDEPGNSVVSTSKYSMNRNYKLFVKNCEIVDLDVNHSFNFLKIAQHTMADTLLISNSHFNNVTGSIFSLDREVEDLGIYNVEDVIIENSSFSKIQGAIANIYRGGTDESTFGPIVSVKGNTFENSGLGDRNKTSASLKFHGVQDLSVENNIWTSSAPLTLYLTNGEPVTVIKNNTMKNSGGIVSNNNEYKSESNTISK